MKERQQYHLPPEQAPQTPRHSRGLGLVRETGSRIKETARRLIPGFPQSLIPGFRSSPSAVQKTNRATATDIDGFPSFAGSNGGWARTEYGEYYATSVLGAQSAGTK